jgi:hypothetical protein
MSFSFRPPTLLRRLVLGVLLLATLAASPVRDEANPSLPPLSSEDLSERAGRLFAAIKEGHGELGDAFFFPREPFLSLKDIDDPGRYYKELVRAYHQNIKDLHAQRKSWDGAVLRGFKIEEEPKRVPPGREWNKIGYFRTRRAKLEYEVAGHRRFIEVHTLISWDGHWYVTHLSSVRR